MTTDLVTWLRQQLDEDDTVIARNRGRAGLGDSGSYPDYQTYDGEDIDAAGDYLRRFAPPRMAAEVDAKRRILDLHGRAHECSVIDRGTVNGEPYEDVDNCAWVLDGDECSTVRLLAAPFADRPGYDERWRP